MIYTNIHFERYCKERAKNGFLSDSQFMNAWRNDPEKWKHLFTLRMRALNSVN